MDKKKYTKEFIEMSKNMKVQHYNDRKSFYYVKSSRSDEIYEVMFIRPKNKWTCNCPSKCYHIGKYCKHIMAVLYKYNRNSFEKELDLIKEDDEYE